MVPLTSDPDFKVTTFLTLNISETTREWYSQSYYRTSIGSHMCSIEWWHLQWPWRTVTRFSRSQHFWCRISQILCILRTNFIYTLLGNYTQSIEWYHFQWPWVTSDPDFKSNIGKTARLKDKKLLFYINRKLYPTYGMVLCWWPWLTSKRVARVCQHQLSFLFHLPCVSENVRHGFL